MYNLYKETVINPVHEQIYRREFNYSFNLSFYKPKKDQCDRCLIFKANSNPNIVEMGKYNEHKNEKAALKAERDIDRQNIDPNHAIVCFDLQSVFSLPKGNASSFFYKRKLNVYNMTATLCLPRNPKVTYCAIWNELHSGRSGDDIASSIFKILKQILSDNPFITSLTLWSDSCVPQNKNKVMSTALLFILNNTSSLKVIEQKFSEPGHSLIQEVDCVHSSIDRYLRNLEVFSQLSLLRHLKAMHFRNVTLKIIQMLPIDFKAFSARASQLNFSVIPFTKVKFLKFNQNDLFNLLYKTSARELEYRSASIVKKASKNTVQTPENFFSLSLRVASFSKPLSKEKINDLKSLFIFMPKADQAYYEALFKMKQ